MSAFMIYASKRRQEMAKKSDAGAGGSSGDLALKVSPKRVQEHPSRTTISEPDLVSKVLSFAGALLGSRAPPSVVNSDLPGVSETTEPRPPALDKFDFDPKVIKFMGHAT